MKRKISIEIKNGRNKARITFGNESDALIFIEKINDCLLEPEKYGSVLFTSEKQDVIFPEQFLRNSIIIIKK